MACGCNNNNGGTPSCGDALTPLRQICGRVYGQRTNSRDTVNGAQLQGILDGHTNKLNQLVIALNQIMRDDCTLADGIVLCRNLAEEVGQSCLAEGGGIPVPPIPPGPLPGGPVLDYPGLNTAYAGWSLRGLTSAYTGPIIRVRRALDNAETDIGLAPNNLIDTAAMINFAQGSDLFVHTIYQQVDQAGAIGHDMVQPVPGQQPKIYDNLTGFETNAADRLCIYFDDVDDFLSGPNTDLRYTTTMLAALALEWHTEANGIAAQIDDEQSVFSAWEMNYRRPSGSSQYWQNRVTSQGGNVSVTGRLNEPWLLTLGCLETGNPITVTSRLNGSLRATDDSGGFTTNSTGRLYLGNNAGGSSVGALRFQELIYFVDVDWAEILPDLAEALRTVLENNMMATWGITPD